MTKFSYFNVLLEDSAALQAFWHIANGIYVWEYVTTLGFELDIIRGRRPYRWTIWIYSLTRAALLTAIIINLVNFNITTPSNCQALIIIQVTVAYVSLVSASLLIIARIVAIWNKNVFAVAIAVIAWVINSSVIIQGVVRLRATWDPIMRACVILNSEEFKLTFVVTLITDTILLVTMLVGLFRPLIDRSYAFGVGRVLWKQGIIWLVIATIAEVPPTVFIFLNLNVPLNLMFLLPSVITNTIAATRIYRSLADYNFESPKISTDADISRSDSKVLKTKCNKSGPIVLSCMEISVDTAYQQSLTSRTTLTSAGAQQGDKPPESSFDSDLECGIETDAGK